MENNQLIANLYSIRAGLSLISNDADGINYSKKRIKHLTQSLDSAKETHSEALSKLSECREKLYAHSDEKVQQLKKRLDNFPSKSSAAVDGLLRTIFIGLILAGVAIYVFGFILMFISEVFFEVILSWQINLIISGALSVIVFVVFLATSICKNVSHYKKLHEEVEKEFKQESAQFNTEHASLEREVRYAESNAATAEREYLSCKEKTAQVITEENNKIKAYASHGKLVYTALRNAYNSTLIEQDWENLDLIIFYFITGRAETMKEALQLVDRERQTQRIIESVRFASREICNSIKNAFAELGSILEASFNMINDRLDSIEDSVGSIRAGISSLNESNRILISKTEMNTALVAKAQRTSDELAKDLKYLRDNW